MTLTAVKPEPAPLDTPTMDERIATVLKAPEDVPAQTFVLMLKWVRAKIVLTKQAAQEALARSLDPAVIDAAALGVAHDAEHAIKRLENAEAALTPHLQVAVRREELENWKARTADLQSRVTDSAKNCKAFTPRQPKNWSTFSNDATRRTKRSLR